MPGRKPTPEPDDGPDPWHHERAFHDAGYGRVAGLDEAGRGPLAGPVVAAAVILPPYGPLDGVRDSKQVPARERQALYQLIRSRALSVGIAACPARVIDRVNILQATRQAMLRRGDVSVKGRAG